MKLAMICQAGNTGLGNIAWGFQEHFYFDKTLIVDQKPVAIFPDRFKNHRITTAITQGDINWLLEEIDILIFFETPYDWNIVIQAHLKGVKTVFMPMDEWLDKSRDELRYVDLFLCPSKRTLENLKNWPGEKIPIDSEVPVDLTKFTPRVIEKAEVFIHNAGHGGIGNRNSTLELLEAIPMVESDVRFIINSQYPLPLINDRRVTVNIANFANYWDMYNEGDVYILLGKYGVAYLGIQEAAASGMPIIFSDTEPFNEYLSRDLLVAPSGYREKALVGGQREKIYSFDPKTIAEKIDQVAAMKLNEYSMKNLKIAESWSWSVWGPRYKFLFEKLCQS